MAFFYDGWNKPFFICLCTEMSTPWDKFIQNCPILLEYMLACVTVRTPSRQKL